MTQPSPADGRPLCTAPGCSKTRRRQAGKYCSMHATRLLRTGSLDRVLVKPIDRFFRSVRQDGECWVWTGQSTHGYGTFAIGSTKKVRAHRWLYQQMRAEVPAELHLDHLCKVTLCVNPWHLEPVTNRVNVLRGKSVVALQAAQTACIHGHDFTPENTYVDKRGHRNCRTCNKLKSAARRKAKREQAA